MQINQQRRQNKNSLESVSKPTPRDGYLLEKERIISEIGDLEQIRATLGLSQRKVCQLLLVDPSAWTRWLNTENGAPPHIYQALRWLIELKKVNPDAAAPSDISSRVDFIHSSTQAKIKELEATIELLEKAVSLQATTSPAPIYTTHHPEETAQLREEVAALKAQIALLLEEKRRARAKRTQHSRKPKAKVKNKTSHKKPTKKRALKAKTKSKKVTKKLAKKSKLQNRRKKLDRK